jgi:uncharacterized membrane protein
MKFSTLFYKVITWRIVSVISMLLTLWIMTGDLVASTGVTIIVQIVQTVVHAIFESTWSKVVERKDE